MEWIDFSGVDDLLDALRQELDSLRMLNRERYASASRLLAYRLSATDGTIQLTE